MRACVLLAVLAVAGCGGEAPSTGGSQRSDWNGRAVGSAAPGEGPPWSEGTANKKLVGLTDDEVKALIGAPDSVAPDPTEADRAHWDYKVPKWLSPPEGSKQKEPSAMTLVLRKGKVMSLYRR